MTLNGGVVVACRPWTLFIGCMSLWLVGLVAYAYRIENVGFHVDMATHLAPGSFLNIDFDVPLWKSLGRFFFGYFRNICIVDHCSGFSSNYSPLFNLIAFTLARLTHDFLFAAHFPQALVHALLAPMFVWWLVRGPIRASLLLALVAGWVTLWDPLSAAVTRNGSLQAGAMALFFAHLLTTSFLFESWQVLKSRRRYLLLSVAGAVATGVLATSYHNLVIVGIGTYWGWLVLAAMLRRVSWASPLLYSCVLAVCSALFLYIKGCVFRTSDAGIPRMSPPFFAHWLTYISERGLGEMFGIYILALAAAGFCLLVIKRRWAATILSLWALSFPFLLAIQWPFPHARFFIPIIPALAFSAAVALVESWNWLSLRGLLTRRVSQVIGVLILACFPIRYYQSIYAPPGGWFATTVGREHSIIARPTNLVVEALTKLRARGLSKFYATQNHYGVMFYGKQAGVEYVWMADDDIVKENPDAVAGIAYAMSPKLRAYIEQRGFISTGDGQAITIYYDDRKFGIGNLNAPP